MRTTTYKCDKCGAEDTDNKIGIDTVGVFVGGYRERYSYGYGPEPRVAREKEWCAECRIRAGLIEKPKDSSTVQAPLTLDDLVREIATEAANEAINCR
jgi:hypothetical protein